MNAMIDPSPLPPWRLAIEAALDADPAEQRHRHLLADLLDEVGDPDAEPVRWLATHNKWPEMPAENVARGRASQWDWWNELRHRVRASAHLPRTVYILMGHHKGYSTRRAAEADFCRAFHQAKANGWDPEEAVDEGAPESL